MFRVSFLVEDKKLATALRLLDGLAYGLEQRPVKTEKPKKGDGTTNQQIGDAALARLPATFTRREFMAAAGIDVPQTASNTLKRMALRKLVRGGGKGGKSWQKVKTKTGADK
jgi:hypothetical protein